MMARVSDQNGFTIIEVMVAITILSIGILGATTLMVNSIGSNNNARSISRISGIAELQLEQLLILPYTHAFLQDANGDGANGLRSPMPALPIAPLPITPASFIANAGANPPDFGPVSYVANEGVYFIYWNIVNNHPFNNITTVSVVVVPSTVTGLGRSIILEGQKINNVNWGI